MTLHVFPAASSHTSPPWREIPVDTRYEARFFGSPELFLDGERVSFPFLKARVLALLLVEERSFTRDRLCALLWGDKTLQSGRRNLSNALSFVRTVLPLRSERRGVIALPSDVTILKDSDRLTGLSTLDWSDVTPLFHPFMDLGEAEEWPAFMEWLLPKRRQYGVLLTEGLRARAEAAMAVQDPSSLGEALACYEQMAQNEPYDEKIHGELARLYIKTGRKMEAVRTAQSFASRIEQDLGLRSDLAEVAPLMQRRTQDTRAMLPVSSAEDNPLDRDREVLQMLNFFYGCGKDGVSSCGFVWGEEGIGKGALVREVADKLSESGWNCHVVRCSQEEEQRLMVPFVQFMQRQDESFLQEESAVSLSKLSCFRMAELVWGRVTAPGAGPNLLVIENIQWMDEASWIILETILWNHSAVRHVLVSGYREARATFMTRTTFADEPFQSLEITLERFTPEQTGRICRILRPGEQWTEAKVLDVYHKTEGSPFFIRELLVPDGEKSEASFPRNPFSSRIELLQPDERRFLETIAVFPGPVSLFDVSEILDRPLLDIADTHDSLRIYGFLREKGDGHGDVHYYFTHSKIREAILAGMSSTRQNALHRKSVEVLKKRDLTPVYRNRPLFALLAWHCEEAGLAREALTWRMEELKLHFHATHEVFPALSDQDLARYIPTAEDLVWTERTLEETRRQLDRVVRLHGKGPEVLRLERDWEILKGGYLWWSGDYGSSLHILREGVRKAIQTKDYEAVAEGYAQLCFLAIQTDDSASLERWGRTLYRLAGEHHLHRWLGLSARFLAIAHILQTQHEPAEHLLRISTRVFERMEEAGPSYTVSLIAAEHFQGDLQLSKGNVREALRLYVNCVRIGESLTLYRGLGLSFAKVAYCSLLLGDLPGAEDALARMEQFQSLFHYDRGSDHQGGGIALSLMGLVEALRGNWSRSGEHFALSESLAAKTGRPTWLAVLYWAKAEVLAKGAPIPADFIFSTLPEGEEHYRLQAEAMNKRIGWAPKRME